MESDIYVLILGSRYGWQPEGKESITELEYQTARNQNIPVLVINTTYPKDALQKKFEGRVEANYFRKTVSDAFELGTELEKALKTKIDKKQDQYFNRTEPVYSNLVKIQFPSHLFIAYLEKDTLEMLYHYLTAENELKTGKAQAKISLTKDQKITLHHD
jgi:hypothetical protein